MQRACVDSSFEEFMVQEGGDRGELAGGRWAQGGAVGGPGGGGQACVSVRCVHVCELMGKMPLPPREGGRSVR